MNIQELVNTKETLKGEFKNSLIYILDKYDLDKKYHIGSVSDTNFQIVWEGNDSNKKLEINFGYDWIENDKFTFEINPYSTGSFPLLNTSLSKNYYILVGILCSNKALCIDIYNLVKQYSDNIKPINEQICKINEELIREKLDSLSSKNLEDTNLDKDKNVEKLDTLSNKSSENTKPEQVKNSEKLDTLYNKASENTKLEQDKQQVNQKVENKNIQQIASEVENYRNYEFCLIKKCDDGKYDWKKKRVNIYMCGTRNECYEVFDDKYHRYTDGWRAIASNLIVPYSE